MSEKWINSSYVRSAQRQRNLCCMRCSQLHSSRALLNENRGRYSDLSLFLRLPSFSQWHIAEKYKDLQQRVCPGFAPDSLLITKCVNHYFLCLNSV